MSSEPAYYPLLRILIALAGAALVFVIMTALGDVIDPPVRAISDYAASYGAAGSLALGLSVIGGTLWWALSGNRADERCRIAETGLMEHRHGPFSEDGWARNLAILLAPLVILAIIVLALWATGTPLPRAILR